MYEPRTPFAAQAPGAGYPPARPPGPGYPPAQPPGLVPRKPARPTALYVVLGLVLLGALLTFVVMYLDQRVLSDMFFGNEEMSTFLPRFWIARLVANVVGVVVALGLLVPTFLGVNWARVLLAVACFGYALVNLGAALGAGFTLVVGRGAFNDDGDMTATTNSVLIGVSLAIDLALFLMVVVCAGILLTGKTRAYTRP